MEYKATAEIRKIVKIGGSLAITLPLQWARKKEITAGTEVVVITDGAEVRMILLQKNQE
jgi:antitoxin component of MazEF toxin-antitoxin module